MMATHLKTDVVHGLYDAIDPAGSLKDSAKGKIVLITGAGRGIGQAIAKAFCAAGADALILCALEEVELRETESLVQSMRPDCRIYLRALDVRDVSAVQKFSQDALQWSNQQLDVLCCNAGVSPPLQLVADSDPNRWWTGIEVNVKGVYLFCRYILPAMQRNKAGHIIITASRAAPSVEEKMSSYQLSKLAVARLADCINEENHEYGIKIFAIHPGGIVTRLLTDMEKSGEPGSKEAGEAIRTVLKEDISLPGNACVFLASGKADSLSGRYIDTTINFEQLLKDKDAIEKHDLLKIGISKNWTPEGGVTHFSRRAAPQIDPEDSSS